MKQFTLTDQQFELVSIAIENAANGLRFDPSGDPDDEAVTSKFYLEYKELQKIFPAVMGSDEEAHDGPREDLDGGGEGEASEPDQDPL